MVVVIQTFGEYLNYHPHLHAIVADGLFSGNGSFYVMPEKDSKKLEQLFRLKVIKMLMNEGLLSEKKGKTLLRWRHSGFSAYRGDRIRRDDEEGLERLSQYIIRNPVHDEKILYESETATVIYRSKHNLKVKGNFKVFSVHDFIDELCQHIPRKGYQMVRYYGWYSNKKRGLRKKEEDETASESVTVVSARPLRVPGKKWQELIKKVWEADPLECPHCKSEMKIVSLIDDRAVIRKILGHLNLWSGDCGRSPPKGKGVSGTSVEYVSVCEEYGFWPDECFSEAVM